MLSEQNQNQQPTGKYRFSREAFMEAVRDKSLDSIQGGAASAPLAAEPIPAQAPAPAPQQPEPKPEPEQQKKKQEKKARKDMTTAEKLLDDEATEKKLEERTRKLQAELNRIRARRDKAAKTRKANAKAAKIEALSKALGGLEIRSIEDVNDACKVLETWAAAHPLPAKPQGGGAGA